MAIQIQLPSAVKKQLRQSSSKGIYEVKYLSEWFGEERAKLGQLTFKKKDDEDLVAYIQGVREQSAKQCGLFIDISPDEKEGIEGKYKTGIHEHVIGGFLIKTSFRVKGFKNAKLFGKDALMVIIHDISVTINVQYEQIPENEPFTLSCRIRNKWYDLRVDKISLARIRIRGKLDKEIIGEGRFVEKAALKKTKTLTYEPIKIFIQPSEEENIYIATIRRIRQMGLKQIASVVDRLWIHEAQRTYKILRNQPHPDKKTDKKTETKIDGHKHVKTAELAEHIFKPKILFLGDGSEWENKISPYADMKQFLVDNPKDVVSRISKERCDLIIADADMGMKNIFAMAVELKLNTDLNNIPIFWIANSEDKNIDQEKAILMEAGAYDYLERDIEKDSLETLIRWALAQSMIGEGDELIIFGKDVKSNYQLGLNLVKGNLKVQQDYKLENPIETMNQSEATWILINSRGMGESYKSILNSSLIWTKKKSHKCYVFLLAETLLQPEEEQRWARAGISEIFVFDTNIKSISDRIIKRMKKVEDVAFEPSIGPGLPSPVIQRQLRKQMDERHENSKQKATSS